MAYKRGRKFLFLGAFSTKGAARVCKARHPGAFVRRKRYKGLGVRYMVLKALKAR